MTIFSGTYILMQIKVGVVNSICIHDHISFLKSLQQHLHKSDQNTYQPAETLVMIIYEIKMNKQS